MKLLLAEQCGDGAKHYRLIASRLEALGAAGGYDPRDGGYSKVFAFLRSLQTPEERSSAGHLTLKALSLARLSALASFCEDKGDADSAHLLREGLSGEERRYYDQGQRACDLPPRRRGEPGARAPRRVSHARAGGGDERADAAPAAQDPCPRQALDASIGST